MTIGVDSAQVTGQDRTGGRWTAKNLRYSSLHFRASSEI